MKPSERRALEAEKRAQKEALEAEKRAQREALEREKQLEKKASRGENTGGDNGGFGRNNETDNERLDTGAEYKKLPEEEIEVAGDGYHRESFFSNHVRLITFIISITLVLTVLGPWGIDMLVSKSRQEWNGDNSQEGKKLTVNIVIALSDKGYDMTWADLNGFGYEDSSYTKKGKTTYNHKYSFEESESLCLEVIGSTNTGSPDIVRLIDYGSGEYIDIRKEAADAFLEKHGYID